MVRRVVCGGMWVSARRLKVKNVKGRDLYIGKSSKDCSLNVRFQVFDDCKMAKVDGWALYMYLTLNDAI